MTYSEIARLPAYQIFLRKLRSTPRDWTFGYNAKIMRGFKERCPLSACCRGLERKQWNLAARQLGIPEGVDFAIVRAADNRIGKMVEDIRRDMLVACGLEDPNNV